MIDVSVTFQLENGVWTTIRGGILILFTLLSQVGWNSSRKYHRYSGTSSKLVSIVLVQFLNLQLKGFLINFMNLFYSEFTSCR